MQQSEEMDLLRAYNQEFVGQHFSNPDLQGRIDAYELAYRMQAEVPGVLDTAKESQSTLDMYGLNDPVTESFGKRCLMARQMVEKGVRFVQIYTPSQSWDGHTEIVKNHTKNAAETDKPIAGTAEGSEAPRPARFHAGRLDGRIRPHAGQSRGSP